MKPPDGPQNVDSRTLFHGDNLPFLRAINSECIDLIATDPPFNKGKDFHATPESLAKGASFQDRWSWDEDVHPDWIEDLRNHLPRVFHVIEGSRKSHGDDMGAFLCFMAVRLLEMHRILRPTGTIFLHCDPTASHYLKQLLDAIFGKDRFRNEIIWHYGGPAKLTDRFPRKHDILLFYTKSENNTFNHCYQELPEYLLKRARKDPDGRLWVDQRLGVTGDTLDRMRAEGRTFKTKSGGERRKQYLDEMQGMPVDSVWQIPIVNSQALERTGYPTQKPIALYKRIIEVSSNEGDWVLDPFAGCATTLIAAEMTGRNWLGIDLWKNVKSVVMDRLAKEARLKLPDGMAEQEGTQHTLWAERLNYSSDLPDRTDDGRLAVAYLRAPTRTRIREPRQTQSRSEMLEKLLHWQRELTGSKHARCPGCLRSFDDDLYFHLDHIEPRSLGGSNAIYNRMPLCGPCNMIKKDDATMILLWKRNRERGRLRGTVDEAKEFLRKQRKMQRQETEQEG